MTMTPADIGRTERKERREMNETMVGFITGLFIGALIGLFALALVTGSRYTDEDLRSHDETICDTDPVKEKLYDVTPQLALSARNVILEYADCVTDCKSCVFYPTCFDSNHADTICDALGLGDD